MASRITQDDKCRISSEDGFRYEFIYSTSLAGVNEYELAQELTYWAQDIHRELHDEGGADAVVDEYKPEFW